MTILGSPEQVALAVWHRQRAEHREFLRGFDPLGDQMNRAFHREVAHPRDERLAGWIGVDPPDETDVELHEVGGKFKDVAEAGVASARVIDCEADGRPERRELPAERGVVLDIDDGMLGDLERDLPPEACQERTEATRADERRRGVEAEESLGREEGRRPEGCLDRGDLELNPEPGPGGGGEDDVGPGTIGKWLSAS